MSSNFDDTGNESESEISDNLHPTRRENCRYGLECFKAGCRSKHPPGRSICEDGIDCDDFDCPKQHPYNRKKKPCKNGSRCRRPGCYFSHPVIHANACPFKDECRTYDCEKWHSKRRPTVCIFGMVCFTIGCEKLHPNERQLCPNGVECSEFNCRLGHPSSRAAQCEQGSACNNYACTFLHPSDWDPCEEGDNCKNPICHHANHSFDRILRLEENENDEKPRRRPPVMLKSKEQRQIEREKAKLPILSVKDEFCQRLKNERILVVTAETGSGKSTQLPQYAAEYFGGTVICTQPRVIAAISLARRVADEYDGTSVGYSVGYRVGHNNVGKDKNRVSGTNIIYMTDGTFIQESQREAELNNIRVLIIDEAHERSLNTDIVMGIAKNLLNTRPTDFYVVISSATIDTEKFLEFFQQTNIPPLKVSGRVYPVSVGNVRKEKGSMEEHAVSTLLQVYQKHEGNTLVFLPGQREIENAMESFKRKTPVNCIALPLYSSLSPEEQDLVLKFDQNTNSNIRMVVFCTNVAETSLTIENIRLVIDSGLVNEGYFDHENRVNVVTSARISQASAEQRKGRAGRTAPGHCIRLYKDNELVCPSTKPQILRASLDLVVLQLISLRFNPEEFSFMDPPDKKHIQTSLDLLKDLSCIDADRDITRKGELFAKLGIDPRYSAFLYDTYLEHGPILEFLAITVAISIAPGSIIAIIGETTEEKENGRDRIATNAKKFNSDLFYFASLYKDWRNVGKIDPEKRTCPTCLKSYNKGYSCGPCRAAYSRTHLLNNKTLNFIESMSEELISTMTDPHWALNPGSLPSANESIIIGNNLRKYFPERCGRLLKGFQSKEHARMNKNGVCARINDMSALFGRKLKNPFFIAASMTKIPGNICMLEKLHPVSPPSALSEDEESTDSDD